MTASPLRLVLAEDGDLLRQGIVALLSGYPELEVVGECGSLPELVAVVNRTDPDVVLTDVRMPPGQSDEGIRAAAWLRQTHPRVGVVVLTQYAEVEYALDLITEGSGGRGYLLKERVANAEEIVAALRTVAEGGSVIDPLVIGPLVDAGSRRPDSPIARLTGREVDVMTRVAHGHSNGKIARDLVVTERAVEKHIGSIFTKLELSSDTDTNRRVAAVLVFLQQAGLRAAVPRNGFGRALG